MTKVNLRTFRSKWKSKKLSTALNDWKFGVKDYSIAMLAIIQSWYNNWQQDINIYTYRAQDLILISLFIDPKAEFSLLMRDIAVKRIQASKIQKKIDSKNRPLYFAGDYEELIDHYNDFDYAIEINNKGSIGHFNLNLISKKLNNNYLDYIEKIFFRALLNPNLELDKLVQISNVHWKRIHKLSNPSPYKYSSNTSVCSQIIEYARKYSGKIALEDECKKITYNELESLTAKTAILTRKHLLKTKARIGICVQRSAEFVIAIIGILRSGASFVPLDPLTPYNRLEFIIQDSKLDLLIIDKEYEWLNKVETKYLYIQHILGSEISDFSYLNKVRIFLDQEAYVIYTSGTSGIPKGVSVSHLSLTFYSNTALRKFKIRRSDRVLQFASLNFDSMIEEIFPCLLAGAQLVLRDNMSSQDIQHFLNLLIKFRITFLDLPTGYWREVLHYFEIFNLKFPSQLRVVIIGGEAMFNKDIKQWFSVTDTLSSLTLFNTYGPTEATVVSTVHEVVKGNSLSNQNPSIGKPISGSTILLVNRLGQICPLGGIGELYIGGLGVAIGYIGQNKIKNLTKFIKLDYNNKYLGRFYKTGDLGYYSDNGELQYLGRIDNQVKIRGFRIEPNEINTVLSTYPNIIDCITIPIKSDSQTNLISFITIECNELYNKENILQYLKLYLPEYMIPSDIILFEKLPKLINGKVDVSYLTSFYLEKLQKDSKVFSENYNYLEKTLIQIWIKILGTSPLDVESDFFEYGGNSLNAIRFSILIRQNFNVEFPSSQLYLNSSIKELAYHLHTGNSTNLPYFQRQEEKFDPLKFEDWRQQESVIKLNTFTNSKKIPLFQENIILTGSTGFLGSHMLYSLLENTNGKIFCIVRGESEAEVVERIKATLQTHRVPGYFDVDKIIPLPGDIGQHKLGLSNSQYNYISKEATRIIHCAADTNMLLPYEKNVITNVDGTKNILELATEGITKRVEYISTMAVFDCNPSLEKVDIDTEMDQVKYISSGYAQSKWVADKLALSAIKQGLDLRIYRCGRIWGNLKDYIGPNNDFIIRFFKGCLAIKAFPKVHMMLDILPIDFITKVIIKYIGNFNFFNDRILHLCNTNALSMEDIIKIIEGQGQAFQVMNYTEWLDTLNFHLKKDNAITNPLYPLRFFFETSNPNDWIDNWLPCKKTEKILAAMNIKFPNVKELIAGNINKEFSI